MSKQNKQADELPIVLGQRLHDVSEDLSPIAKEAIRTADHMFYSLMVVAINVFMAANTDKALKKWGSGYAAAVTYWAGFLEGVRTQKQKQRKKAKEKPLSDPDARRQALKILANDEQQSL